MAGDSKRKNDLALRRRLRREQTPAESQLWGLLRGRGVDGVKFRRQAPVCGWVVDFACVSHRLVVELDGAVHDVPDQLARDRDRDAWLRENGWTNLRFRNGDLRFDPDGFIRAIRLALGALGALTPAAARRPLSRRAGEGWENQASSQGIPEDVTDP